MRFPHPVEALMEMFEMWGACVSPDPLEVPLDVRRRRRAELAILRAEVRGEDLLARRLKRKAKTYRRKMAEREAKAAAAVEALAAAARLCGACA